VFEKLKEAKEVFLDKLGKVDVAVITGTGIKINIAKVLKKLDYGEIPHIPETTTKSHRGYFEISDFDDKRVVVANGRFHYYEGYSLEDVVFLARLLGLSGARLIILTNAAGGLSPFFKQGDLMVANDHINMMGANPLRGKNIDELGERFPDMGEVYSRKHIEMIKKAALENGIDLKEGVYLSVAGPSMETPAETRAFRLLGADAIGMSTVPEAIALRHMGINCISISIITNLNKPDCMSKAAIDDVINVAHKSSVRLSKLITYFLGEL